MERHQEPSSPELPEAQDSLQKPSAEEAPEQTNKRLSGITIFCPLCGDYLAHSVTTSCEHTFCELCLSEYMVYLDECPECRNKIRNQKQANNILLDNLILDYIKKFEVNEVEEYEKRLEQYKEYKKKRTVGQLDTGMLVDVRDLDFVWCTGRIHRTINKYHDRKVKYVIVKYDRSTKKEEIPEASPRLAPRGFFTAREDIPRYEKGKLVLRSPEEGVSYQLVKQSEDEEEEEEKKGEA